MFASRFNYQLERYVSFLPDLEAVCVDAFSFPLKNENFYIISPFSMLGKVLQKIQQDKANAIVIAPLWPTQAWFPTLLEIIYQQPYLLNIRNTLTIPTDPKRQHRIPRLKMGCFPLSGNFFKTGISEELALVIFSSWRKSLQRQYWTYIKRWLQFCDTRNIDSCNSTVNNFCVFYKFYFINHCHIV